MNKLMNMFNVKKPSTKEIVISVIIAVVFFVVSLTVVLYNVLTAPSLSDEELELLNSLGSSNSDSYDIWLVSDEQYNQYCNRYD